MPGAEDVYPVVAMGMMGFVTNMCKMWNENSVAVVVNLCAVADYLDTRPKYFQVFFHLSVMPDLPVPLRMGAN